MALEWVLPGLHVATLPGWGGFFFGSWVAFLLGMSGSILGHFQSHFYPPHSFTTLGTPFLLPGVCASSLQTMSGEGVTPNCCSILHASTSTISNIGMSVEMTWSYAMGLITAFLLLHLAVLCAHDGGELHAAFCWWLHDPHAELACHGLPLCCACGQPLLSYPHFLPDYSHLLMVLLFLCTPPHMLPLYNIVWTPCSALRRNFICVREGVIAHSQGGKCLALRRDSHLLGMLVTSLCLAVSHILESMGLPIIYWCTTWI